MTIVLFRKKTNDSKRHYSSSNFFVGFLYSDRFGGVYFYGFREFILKCDLSKKYGFWKFWFQLSFFFFINELWLRMSPNLMCFLFKVIFSGAKHVFLFFIIFISHMSNRILFLIFLTFIRNFWYLNVLIEVLAFRPCRYEMDCSAEPFTMRMSYKGSSAGNTPPIS